MTWINLPFVQAFRGKQYYYFRKPGCARVRLPGLPGSAGFMRAYEAALAEMPLEIGASRNAPGTVAALVAAYANSAHFKHEIAPETRRTQWPILQRFRDGHGQKRVAMLKREHLLALLAEKKPHPKRNWLRAVRPMMQFVVEIGMIAADPTEQIKVKVPRGSGFRPWGDNEIAIFRQRYAIGTRARLAFELLLGTVQRCGDVVRMGPQHVRGDLLNVQTRNSLMTTVALALHIFGAVVWVGGMFAIYVCLRPALDMLKPPQRLRLMRVERKP